MKKGVNLLLLSSLVLVSLLVSCSKKGDVGEYEAVPFQETEDGQWGMISLDGKVIFKDEFKNQPTMVRDGRFFVKNKEDAWEMYDASEKPKKIGKEFVYATPFEDGRALVTERGKHISIIDKDGTVIKEITKIDGKSVEQVSAFSNGYSIYFTADSLYGVMDKDGNGVVKADYCYITDAGEGKFFAVANKYKKDAQADKKGKVKISVIDTSGKELFSFNGDKYEDINPFSGDYMPVSVKKEGKTIWGLVDTKGEYVVKPSAKLKGIGNIRGDKFTYTNGEGWGLMNVKGEILIRAKYDQLYYDVNGKLMAGTKDGDDTKWKFIDEKDNQIGKDTYVDAVPYSVFDGKHTVVKVDDKSYAIIDADGKQLEGLPDMTNVGLNSGDSYAESDFVDFKQIIDGFNITANGALGLTFNSTPQQVVRASVKEGSAFGTDENPAGTPYWYDGTDNVSISKNVDGIVGNLEIDFAGYLSRQTYTTHRVIDYDDGYYQYYHDEQTPTGYVWNSFTPNVFQLTINHNGRMKGKLRGMLKALIAKFKTFGSIVKENDGAAVLKLNNGKTALIYMTEDHVTAAWGLLGDPKSIDISRYKDVSENLEDSSAMADSTTSDYDYADVDTSAVYDADTAYAEADSTAY